MNDLINRQEAIDALDRAAECWNIAEPFNEGMRAGYKAAVTIVLSLPSAQPKSYREGYQAGFKDSQPERKKGEWIEREVTHIDDLEAKDIITAWQSCKCSVCGRYDTKPYMYYFNAPKYCSWCGAEMEVSES